MDKQASKEHPIDEQAKINQPDKFINNNHDVSINDVLKEPVKAEIQSIVWVPFLQEKLADQRPPLVYIIVTMLPQKTTQPPQPPQSRRKTKVFLKKSKKLEAQAGTNVILKRLTKIETKVEAMSKFNLLEAIDKSVQAHLKKNLPKVFLTSVNSNKRKLQSKACQNHPDKELVLVKDQVQIGSSNYRLALEKSQPNVIYKGCLAILKKFYFFNAFIRTTDAPEIYMQQFWHTLTYDLTAKTYFFTLDDQIFEVNADLLREALQITHKVSDHPFVKSPSEKEIISFIKKLGYSESLTKISDMAINNMYQPWRTFVTMIKKCLTKNASGFDRP
ncbi:hypothetical protein Tco_0397000 [Tanacetum coccineum]